MRRVYWFALFLLVPSFAQAQAQQFTRLQGWCEDGNYNVVIPGTQGSGNQRFQRSFPSCTVTVFLAGTTTPVTIYANATGTARPNPFTAAASGQWFFYAPPGGRFDVRFSGGGIPTPFTIGDMIAPGGSGGTGPPIVIPPSPQGNGAGTLDIWTGPNSGSTVSCPGLMGIQPDLTGSTTLGLQECINYARANSYGSVHLRFMGGTSPSNAQFDLPGCITIPQFQRFIMEGGFINYVGPNTCDNITLDSHVDSEIRLTEIVGNVDAAHCVVRIKPTVVVDQVIAWSDVEFWIQGIFDKPPSTGSGLCIDTTLGAITYSRLTWLQIAMEGSATVGPIVNFVGTNSFCYNRIFSGHIPRSSNSAVIQIDVPASACDNTWDGTTANGAGATQPVIRTAASTDTYRLTAQGWPVSPFVFAAAALNNTLYMEPGSANTYTCNATMANYIYWTGEGRTEACPANAANLAVPYRFNGLPVVFALNPSNTSPGISVIPANGPQDGQAQIFATHFGAGTSPDLELGVDNHIGIKIKNNGQTVIDAGSGVFATDAVPTTIVGHALGIVTNAANATELDLTANPGDPATRIKTTHSGAGVTLPLQIMSDTTIAATFTAAGHVTVGDPSFSTGLFNVVSTTGSAPPAGDPVAWFVSNGPKAVVRLQNFSGTNGTQPVLAGLGARGTLAVPAPPQNDELLLSLDGRGYDGSTNNMGEYAPGWTTSQAVVQLLTSENWDATHHGTQIRFYVTPRAGGAVLPHPGMIVGDTSMGPGPPPGNSVCIQFASGLRLLTTNGVNITDGGPCPF